MCGIGFISAGESSDLDVREVTRRLLHNLAERGPHAAGIAWKRPTDGVTLYRKSPGHPARLAQYVAQRTGSRSLDGAAAVLIHTRWATHGSPDVNENNHPVLRSGVALIHNGVLRNPGHLYDVAYAEPEAEVDTDALAALVETAPDIDTIIERFQEIDGAAAVAWLEVTDDVADHRTLYVARIDTRPVVLAVTDDEAIVGASTEEAIRRTARTAGFGIRKVMHLKEGDMLRLEGGRITERWDMGTGSGGVDTAYGTGRKWSYAPRFPGFDATAVHS